VGRAGRVHGGRGIEAAMEGKSGRILKNSGAPLSLPGVGSSFWTEAGSFGAWSAAIFFLFSLFFN
jgi:hypothetical protein